MVVQATVMVLVSLSLPSGLMGTVELGAVTVSVGVRTTWMAPVALV